MKTFTTSERKGIIREILEAEYPRIIAAFNDSDLLLAVRKYARLNDPFHVHLVEAAIHGSLDERLHLVKAFFEHFRQLLVEVVWKDPIPRDLPEDSGLAEFVLLGTLYLDIVGETA